MDPDPTLEEAIQQAALHIISGAPIVAFTGAGISVESGIPDFRSPGGLWTKYDPSVYCNFSVFQDRPDLFWTMAVEMHESVSRAQPNPAHLALAELEQFGLLSCIITQNVDNLHQVGGHLPIDPLSEGTRSMYDRITQAMGFSPRNASRLCRSVPSKMDKDL